ncbi:bifunctional UDP-N-acetylglucosamine diphosphorylase/glucosamine-1-phosphate N-acetyltransferase GlmU [bacterium]|nr:bifunctional UDP-N-acetylglucosamine diphosphorylase/glucosamine-1-phosphate N-acetyltransferase GlmU [bacterium]
MDGKVAVVVLAAGKSTRFKSSTSKLLHELCGKPMIEWVLDAALPLDPAQIIVVYGTHTSALAERYAEGYQGHALEFVLQDPPLGTGHALMQVRKTLAEEITQLFVLNGDALLVTSQELGCLQGALASEGAEHALLTTTVAPPHDLGCVLRKAEGSALIERIVEAQDAGQGQLQTEEVNTGVYLFSRNVFEHLEQAQENIGAGQAKGEYYLPDVARISPTLALHSESIALPVGVNDRAQLAEAEAVLLGRLRRHWMEEGVTFYMPESTYLHHDVKLAPDMEVGPHCVLTRGTRIGAGTKLIQGCYLQECEIGKDCTLLHVRGTRAVLHDGVRAGPYVNLRPGTVLREGVKVGNFVETKKADVGRGSKLPHLQYVGDATVGEGVNIGAGTIFCNYDGVDKHHTTVGDHVFIGSNSSLQAPLTIGDGAYVAMGSSITKDVPPGALAIGRARQENKEGFAKTLKERNKRRKEQAQAERHRGES